MISSARGLTVNDDRYFTGIDRSIHVRQEIAEHSTDIQSHAERHKFFIGLQQLQTLLCGVKVQIVILFFTSAQFFLAVVLHQDLSDISSSNSLRRATVSIVVA